jgi:hypothetical protein
MKSAVAMAMSVVCGCLLAAADGRTEEGKEAALIYTPVGDAIVLVNGTRWNNRPLYGHERMSLVWSGEMPGLQGEMGTLLAGYERGEVRLALHQFATRIMRSRPGRMEWECRDERLPGLTVRLEATMLADADGYTARLSTQGRQPGDRALWCYFPPEGPVTLTPRGVRITREGHAPIEARLSFDGVAWASLPPADRDRLDQATPVEPGTHPGGTGWIAGAPMTDDAPHTIAVAREEEKSPAAPAVADSAEAFRQGMASAEGFNARLVVETPDPYLNAGAPFSVSASAGVFVDPTFVHGGSQWRIRMPGWRTMGGSIYYGWLDRVRRAVAYWGQFQLKDAPDRTGAEFSSDGTRQVGNSIFYGKGFLNYPHMPHYYEFQTQFFDEALRAWRASADPELEALLLPMLELHLERAKVCFDADGDWTYDSYNNTWPNDSIWFNGGGTPEQTAYMYYGHRAAADMYRRAGDAENAERHTDIAEKIRAAIHDVLWMPERGHFASYVEPQGHQRQMPDAWVWGQYVPIESGLTTPEQAWRAMYYTEWAMERFQLPFGEMRQSSNFLPGQWSVRELYHGDNFGMALGYFLAGQGDEGWRLMRGAMIESMYGDGVPKSGYSRESGQFNLVNHISPGGLSHPNCAIDFTDITSIFSRALVEGLFGYRPDYPNGVVRLEPTLPSDWDRASIRTPDFSLEIRDQTYTLNLVRPAVVNFGVPVRASKVRRVTVNGEDAEYAIEPWAGYGMLLVSAPKGTDFVLRVETEGPVVAAPVVEREEAGDTPGHRLVLNAIEGEVPRYQLVKIHVPEQADPRVLREAPADAAWRPIALDGVHNGDLRTIFKQRYVSPRPDHVAMRIGYDGWTTWTFALWGIAVPEIRMQNVFDAEAPDRLIRDGRLVTPQQARFLTPTPEKNIAFTSLWDNWPVSVNVPVHAKGEAVWLLVAGSASPMQGRIANAVIRFHYADGETEALEIVPPLNYWAVCRFGNTEYQYARDGFSMSKEPPTMVQLGDNCRAMVYGWKLRPGVELKDITLETLSLDVVVGLMGVSVMNPEEPAAPAPPM